MAAGGGFLGAVVGTTLPWSGPNYSHYTGLFGGWGFSPLAWSLVAALGAVAGLALWTALMVGRWTSRPLAWLLPMAATLSVAGTILYLGWPPFATHPWLGPWVTLIAAAAALAGSLRTLSTTGRARSAGR